MEEEARRQAEGLPGCGLAAFAGLLLVIFTIGVIGVSVSTYSVFTAGEQLSPQLLSYGGVVDPSLLGPMRDAGLLGKDEIPDAFHAETLDGTSACALSAGKLLRLEEGVGSTLSLDTVTDVREEADGVVVVGASTVRCAFRPDEGAERFARMIRSRQKI
ncbi:MAG: hypothetical protein ACOZNI_13260 [Myxococcota bacterium]